jgi:hypothetical protein
VKYLLLIFANEQTKEMLADEKERDKVFAEVGTLMAELTESGEWVGGHALGSPDQARGVKVRGGVPVVTDGPFAEAKEYIAGYCVVECASLERATEIAARWPDARIAGMEVWPMLG